MSILCSHWAAPSIRSNITNMVFWVYGILSMLEPCEVKVSRRVLRGLGSENTPRLPDTA